MIALLLAVLMSSSIAVVFRVSERGNLNRYAVTAVNYLAACAVAAVMFTRGGARAPELSALGGALGEAGTPGLLSPGAALWWALFVGLPAGAVYFLSFVLYQVGVRRHGVALAGASAKLGVLVPAAASLLLFGERPTAAQWGGLAAAGLAVLLLALPGRGGAALRPSLLLLLLLSGLAEFANKVFERRGALTDRALFLFAVFGAAFLLAVSAVLLRRRPFGLREVAAGACVGVPNFFSSYFLIRALSELPATAVFPAFGAGTILVLTLAGAVLFHERIGRREVVVLAFAAAGVALLGL